MQLSRLVNREHPIGNLREHVHQARNVELRAADGAQKVDTFNELHRVEPLVALGHELVQPDQIGMRHIGQDPELAFEARHGIRAGVKEGLEGDQLAPLPIERGEHHAHAPRPELALEPEPGRSLKLNVTAAVAQTGRGRRGGFLTRGDDGAAALGTGVVAMCQAGATRRAEQGRGDHRGDCSGGLSRGGRRKSNCLANGCRFLRLIPSVLSVAGRPGRRSMAPASSPQTPRTGRRSCSRG